MFEAIVIFGFVAGAILGSRFKVFVLVPAILLASAALSAVSFANGVNLPTTVLAVLASWHRFNAATSVAPSPHTSLYASVAPPTHQFWRPSQFY